jgi:hypothetical protein
MPIFRGSLKKFGLSLSLRMEESEKLEQIMERPDKKVETGLKNGDMVAPPCLMTSTGCCCNGMEDRLMFSLSVLPRGAVHPADRPNHFPDADKFRKRAIEVLHMRPPPMTFSVNY